MEWRFCNIFLIYPTISRTRDMSLGNFFECRLKVVAFMGVAYQLVSVPLLDLFSITS